LHISYGMGVLFLILSLITTSIVGSRNHGLSASHRLSVSVLMNNITFWKVSILLPQTTYLWRQRGKKALCSPLGSACYNSHSPLKNSYFHGLKSGFWKGGRTAIAFAPYSLYAAVHNALTCSTIFCSANSFTTGKFARSALSKPVATSTSFLSVSPMQPITFTEQRRSIAGESILSIT